MAPQLIERYVNAGQLRIVWNDFAWIGEESRLAAQGAHCAGQQDRFWEYHDHLYNNQRGENRGNFAAANLKAFAVAVGLDSGRFDSCLDRGEDLQRLRDAVPVARQRGINATPYFFINGERLVAGNVGAFSQAIDNELRRLGR